MTDRNITYIIRVRDEAAKQLRDIQGAALSATAALGGIAFVTKQAIDFESSFAGVRKTVDASEAEFQALAKNFRTLAKQIPVNVNQLNRIGELAGQLGVRGVDNLTKFTDSIAKIAVTTNLTEEEAATAFARIANVTQEPISHIDRMASSVVALGNNFATTESEIVDFSQRIAGAGKIAGLTTDEIFGIAAAFSSVGIQAEAGGTAVQTILLNLNKEGKRGIGEFLSFVQNLSAAGPEAAKVLDELGFSEARLQRAFLSVAGAGGVLEDAIRSSTDAFRENNALTNEAEKRFATTASQLTILKNQLTDMAITIGSLILPILVELVGKMQPVINAVARWIEEHPILSKWLLVIITVVSTLVAGIGALTLALTGVIAVLGAILSPIGLVVVALTGIVTAIGVLMTHWEGLKWMVSEAVNSMKEAIANFALDLAEKFGIAEDKAKQLLKTLKDVAAQAGRAIIGAIPVVGPTINAATRATGGYAGGPTIVGEQGPELVNLPRGSFVNNARDTERMLRGGERPIMQKIEINLGGVTVQNEADEDRLVQKLARQLQLISLQAA